VDYEASESSTQPAVEVHEFVTIDDSRYQRLRHEGIIIGVVTPHWCCVPHERPVVRAMLITRNAAISFTPAKYTKGLRVEGEVQIPVKDVDYGTELAALPLWEVVNIVR
jgi:hypothetical protein